MTTRRRFISTAVVGAAISAVMPVHLLAAGDQQVTANEDLMREHGVLRRALLVYQLSAKRLRSDPRSVPPDSLNRTAGLFRAFGENYHERALEEPFIFLTVKKNDGPAAKMVDILLAQHQRGRQITDYILAETAKRTLSDRLADVLDSFVLMYQEHTAREDTITFPAWHKSLSKHEYGEMGEKFEDIERKQFGSDGFDDAVNQISRIEQELKLANLAEFTAPEPPT